MPQQKSFSVDELNHLTRVTLTESELKRQLSHDLANDPALATVFNPPQIFSDSSLAETHGGPGGLSSNGAAVVVHWTNNDVIVSVNNFPFRFQVFFVEKNDIFHFFCFVCGGSGALNFGAKKHFCFFSCQETCATGACLHNDICKQIKISVLT